MSEVVWLTTGYPWAYEPVGSIFFQTQAQALSSLGVDVRVLDYHEHALSAGKHTVKVVRTGRSDSWTGTMDVRAGETKSFVVKVSPDQVYLDPVSRID